MFRKMIAKHLMKRAGKIAMLDRPEIEEEFIEEKETCPTSHFYLTILALLVRKLTEL